MKQLKITVEVSDVRSYGTTDNNGEARMCVDYSSEDSLKGAKEVITLDAMFMLINAAKDANFKLAEEAKKVEEN